MSSNRLASRDQAQSRAEDDAAPLTPRQRAAAQVYWRGVRMEQIHRDGKIRRLECPLCHALPGEDCHSSPGWHFTPFHVGRVRLAGVR